MVCLIGAPHIPGMPGYLATLCCHLCSSITADDHSGTSGAHLEAHGVRRAPLRAFPRRYNIARIWLSRQYGLQLPATQLPLSDGTLLGTIEGIHVITSRTSKHAIT